jgi:hypothetical protein
MRLVAVLCYYIKVFVRQFYVYSIEQSIFARIEHVKLKYATVCLNGNVTEPKINLIFIVEKYILYSHSRQPRKSCYMLPVDVATK